MFIRTICLLIYVAKQPDVYKATTLLVPAGEQSSAGGLG